jgi:hypothetical protein
MQRAILYACFTLALSVIQTGIHHSARADEQSDLQDQLLSASLAADGTEATIVGQVKFEQRYTRIPQQVCVGTPCQSSKLYWSVVIYSGNVRYLVDQKLNLGVDRAPEFVELNGVRLTAGSTVKIVGKIVPGSPDLYFLLSVDRVTLLEDHALLEM